MFWQNAQQVQRPCSRKVFGECEDSKEPGAGGGRRCLQREQGTQRVGLLMQAGPGETVRSCKAQ